MADQVRLPDNRALRVLTRREMLIGIGVLVAVLIVIDIWLAVDDTSGNTWSELIRIAGKKTIVVPWLLGLVMGHWFHPGDNLQPAIAAPGNTLVLIGSIAAVTLLGVFVALPLWLPLVAGAVVGAWLWPVTAHPDLPVELEPS